MADSKPRRAVHKPWRWMFGPTKGALANIRGGEILSWCGRPEKDQYQSEDFEAVTCPKCRELVLLSVERALASEGWHG